MPTIQQSTLNLSQEGRHNLYTSCPLPIEGADAVLHEVSPEIKEVIGLFLAISSMARPSLQEDQIVAFLSKIAQTMRWEYHIDEAKNIAIYIPGKGRGLHSEHVILQAHSDEVELPLTRDFHNEPRLLEVGTREIDGVHKKVLTARESTLGSDNGFGIAAALEIALSDSIDHPPLTLLFTANEENGMTGIRAITRDILKGNILINLDSEDFDITVGCAGARDLVAQKTLKRTSPAQGMVPIEVAVSGFPRLHSGMEIHNSIDNPIHLLAKELADSKFEGCLLASIDGGERRNVTPTSASAVLWCPEELVPNLDFANVRRLDTNNAPLPMTKEEGRMILDTITSIPHGVISWSADIHDAVETSSNFAQVRTIDDTLEFTLMSRSSRDGAIEELQESIAERFRIFGAEVEVRNGYPGWLPDMESPLLHRVVGVFARELGTVPPIKAVHAGLECGLIRSLIPDIEMISIGPRIVGAHSTEEALVLDSVVPFMNVLRQLLSSLCD